MTNILTLDSVGFAVAGRQLLQDITWQVPTGASITITGPSGSGKSTLLRLLATLLTPTSGTITYAGKPQTALPKPDYRQQVSYCFQQPSLFGDTVRDNLNFPFAIRNQAFDEARAVAALESVALAPSQLDADITDLSGGEKQRVALIRNLLFQPQVLLLDEITTGLDPDTKAIVHALIERQRTAGVTVIAVTHDESEVAAATQIVTIQEGRLYE